MYLVLELYVHGEVIGFDEENKVDDGRCYFLRGIQGTRGELRSLELWVGCF